MRIIALVLGVISSLTLIWVGADFVDFVKGVGGIPLIGGFIASKMQWLATAGWLIITCGALGGIGSVLGRWMPVAGGVIMLVIGAMMFVSSLPFLVPAGVLYIAGGCLYVSGYGRRKLAVE